MLAIPTHSMNHAEDSRVKYYRVSASENVSMSPINPTRVAHWQSGRLEGFNSEVKGDCNEALSVRGTDQIEHALESRC